MVIACANFRSQHVRIGMFGIRSKSTYIYLNELGRFGQLDHSLNFTGLIDDFLVLHFIFLENGDDDDEIIVQVIVRHEPYQMHIIPDVHDV